MLEYDALDDETYRPQDVYLEETLLWKPGDDCLDGIVHFLDAADDRLGILVRSN